MAVRTDGWAVEVLCFEESRWEKGGRTRGGKRRGESFSIRIAGFILVETDEGGAWRMMTLSSTALGQGKNVM